MHVCVYLMLLYSVAMFVQYCLGGFGVGVQTCRAGGTEPQWEQVAGTGKLKTFCTGEVRNPPVGRGASGHKPAVGMSMLDVHVFLFFFSNCDPICLSSFCKFCQAMLSGAPQSEVGSGKWVWQTRKCRSKSSAESSRERMEFILCIRCI